MLKEIPMMLSHAAIITQNVAMTREVCGWDNSRALHGELWVSNCDQNNIKMSQCQLAPEKELLASKQNCWPLHVFFMQSPEQPVAIWYSFGILSPGKRSDWLWDTETRKRDLPTILFISLLFWHFIPHFHPSRHPFRAYRLGFLYLLCHILVLPLHTTDQLKLNIVRPILNMCIREVDGKLRQTNQCQWNDHILTS